MEGSRASLNEASAFTARMQASHAGFAGRSTNG